MKCCYDTYIITMKTILITITTANKLIKPDISKLVRLGIFLLLFKGEKWRYLA